MLLKFQNLRLHIVGNLNKYIYQKRLKRLNTKHSWEIRNCRYFRNLKVIRADGLKTLKIVITRLFGIQRRNAELKIVLSNTNYR